VLKLEIHTIYDNKRDCQRIQFQKQNISEIYEDRNSKKIKKTRCNNAFWNVNPDRNKDDRWIAAVSELLASKRLHEINVAYINKKLP